jgi:hypothetical protein
MRNTILLLLFTAMMPVFAQLNFNLDNTSATGAIRVLLPGAEIIEDLDQYEITIKEDQLYTFPGIFELHIKKADFVFTYLPGYYMAKEYRVDMNSDGTWEQNWSSAGQSTVSFNYAPAAANQYFRPETIKIEMKFRNQIWPNNEVTISRNIQIHVFPDKRVYTNPANDMLVQLQNISPSSKRPILLVEGFDPLNTNYPDLYYLLAFHLINEDLRFSGQTGLHKPVPNDFAVFILNFNNGGQDLAQNAPVVLSALNKINALCPGKDIAVAGLSMGGVITRYALAKAEQDGIDHHTDMFISFDSPQAGAHINMQLQSLVSLLPEGVSSVTDDLQLKLKSMAAKQLMLDNVYDPSGHAHQQFYSALNQLNGNGYPSLCANLAISNGRSQASWGPDYEDETLMELTIDNFSQSLVTFEPRDIGPGSYLSDTQMRELVYPGGSFYYAASAALLEYDPTVFLDIYYDPVFIPTWSALDIPNHNIDSGYNLTNDLNTSRFDDYMVQDHPIQHHEISVKTRNMLKSWFLKYRSFAFNNPFEILTRVVINTNDIVFQSNVIVGNGGHVTILKDRYQFNTPVLIKSGGTMLVDAHAVKFNSGVTVEEGGKLIVLDFEDLPQLVISGPGSVVHPMKGKPRNTYRWTANLENSKKVSYKWYKKTTGDYYYYGSGKTLTKSFSFVGYQQPSTFTLKVIATENGEEYTETKTIRVTHEATGGGIDPFSLSKKNQNGNGELTANKYSLGQNYPNPFNPTTVIPFALPESANISIVIYDVTGRQIKSLASGNYGQGVHSINWNAQDDNGNKVASGIYYYRLDAKVTDGKAFTQINKMIVTK